MERWLGYLTAKITVRGGCVMRVLATLSSLQSHAEVTEDYRPSLARPRRAASASLDLTRSRGDAERSSRGGDGASPDGRRDRIETQSIWSISVWMDGERNGRRVRWKQMD
jgi:hypothetical protein